LIEFLDGMIMMMVFRCLALH